MALEGLYKSVVGGTHGSQALTNARPSQSVV